jgi:hypothetical protein
VSSIRPARGPSNGGTRITIRGTNFTASSLVFVGGNPITNLTLVDSTTLVGTTQGGTRGEKAVSVRDPRGNIIVPSAFRYVKSS